jgi:hypothetical protein
MYSIVNENGEPAPDCYIKLEKRHSCSAYILAGARCRHRVNHLRAANDPGELAELHRLLETIEPEQEDMAVSATLAWLCAAYPGIIARVQIQHRWEFAEGFLFVWREETEIDHDHL